MMPNGQGNQLAHGHPGTPVGDLFPLGQALSGDGGGSSLRPIRKGELRSHSAGYEPNAPYGPRGMRENRGRSPRAGNAEILGQSIRMVGQFLHMQQGDQEQMASRVHFVLSIWSNRLCAMEVKNDENKLGRCMPLHYDNAIDAVSLLHSCPWSLEPYRAIVNIHMLSTPVQGGTIPP